MIVELVGFAWMWRGFVPYGHGVQFDVHDCAHPLVLPQSVFNNLCNSIWKHPCRCARCVDWIEQVVSMADVADAPGRDEFPGSFSGLVDCWSFEKIF